MKCPKCDYLGFETGDRCKNCGYDFSLLVEPAPPADLDPDPAIREFEQPVGPDHWLNQLDETLSPRAETARDARVREEFFDISFTPSSVESPLVDARVDAGVGTDAPADAAVDLDLAMEPAAQPDSPPERPAPAVMAAAPAPRMTLIDKPAERPAAAVSPSAPAGIAAAKRAEQALPLFMPAGDDDDDTPLIKLPAAPRAPLSVRRTPDTPRLRTVPRPRPEAAPALAFSADTMVIEDDGAADPPADVRAASRVWRGAASNGEAGSAARRLTAAAIDHAILLSIDLVVVYFTLRMAALDMGDWALLPRAPLALFLMLIKFAYFCAFTAIGGQTIGKMAARIRVVTDDDGALDGAQAARRTLVGVLSAVTFGIGFLPGLVGDRRTLHDRAAHTRVVGLESA